ncbi:hypothetical protein VZT92_017297 [Zoarces viviparus]|uniref:Ferric-chelate reductase 1 n=1 Tax=Zoarces viviparus TaxID=48416 RepID=A0AAW1ESK9_ZOAVI
MDNRLVLTVLFVTLSWMSAGNYVQAAGNVTMPAANLTSATNVTTAAGNNTNAAGNNTTAAGNNTTAAGNNTTAAGNNTTAAGNNTTAAPATAPPLMPNTTVETLKKPVSRAECGSKRLCGAQPTDCDPSTSNSCFFASFKQRGNSRNFEIEISGESDGYVACTLSRDSTLGGNDTTYVCANNNGTVQFFGALLDNNQLTEIPLKVNSVKGKVNGSKIQCTFAATAPPPSATKAATKAGESFAIGISTGPFNSTDGTLGSPTSRFVSGLVDLSNTTSATNVPTAAGNNTTAAPATAPPLMTNTTVETLEKPVSRAECGSKRLCGAQPTDCDPSTSNSCFFASFKQRGNSRNFEIEISGESDGYVACTLSRDSTLGGNDTTYVCANNNGTVQFFGALLDNNQLTETTLNVNSVKGKVNGSKIQCTFAATAPPPSATKAATKAGESFAIGISTGPFNSTDGTLGSPTSRFVSGLVDLSNPNATVTNTLNANTTTASPNTTSHGITLQQSLMQAVLMTVGVLSLATL